MPQIVLPTSIIDQPSTGKKIKIRPFTVKEEKALLLALNDESMSATVNAIKDLVRCCTFDQIDPEQVPYYDLEFIFLNIRAKSIGEIVDLVGRCDCSETAKTDFTVDIGDTKIEPAPKTNNMVTIVGTEYSVQFRHPSIDDFIKIIDNPNKDLEILAGCMQSVYNKDEVFNWTIEEKLEFMESMTPAQQESLKTFLKEMPMVRLDSSYKCRACGKAHTHILSGFENFFV